MYSCEIKYKRIFDQGPYTGLLELSDAKIYTEDGSLFDIHKVILAKRSDFFRAMFCGFEKGKKLYKISNISGHLLSDILAFIYTKYVNVTETNIHDLLIAADFFRLNPLYSVLKSQIKINLMDANCLSHCLTAFQLNDREILRWCLNFIAPRFEEIIGCQKNDVGDFPLQFLKFILSNGNLNVQSERIIWEVIVQWVQVCPQSRLEHVTSLLSTLAVCEISTKLAREILNHEIMSNIRPPNSNIFPMNGNRPNDVLESILEDFKPNKFRIPQKLTLISENTNQISVKIFISIDEAVVSWCKIGEVTNFYAGTVVTLGSKVYIFDKLLYLTCRCAIFNLKTMRWKIIKNTYIRYIVAFLTVENTLYTVVYENLAYHIDEYDVEKNRRIRISSLSNCNHASAAAIGENIFFVGMDTNLKNNITQMFSLVTHQWKDLNSPIKFRKSFKLVPYHNKIYLVVPNTVDASDPEVEVFDPATNVWKVLPELYPNCYGVDAIILADKLIVYNSDYGQSGGEEESTAEFLNESTECWEVLERSALPQDMRYYRSCSIEDVGSIKILSKRYRISKEKIQKSPFNDLY